MSTGKTALVLSLGAVQVQRRQTDQAVPSHVERQDVARRDLSPAHFWLLHRPLSDADPDAQDRRMAPGNR